MKKAFRKAGRLAGRALAEVRNWDLLQARPRREERARARFWKGKPEDPSGPILVTQLADIGDLVITGPFLRSLRRAFPRSRIVLVVSPLTVPLARICPHVDEVAVFDAKGLAGWEWIDKHRGCRKWWEAAAALRDRHFPEPPALAFSPRSEQDSIQAASQIVIACSRARRRVAYGLKDLFGKLRSLRLIDLVVELDCDRHETDRQLDLLRAAGVPLDDSGTPETWGTPESFAEAERIATPFLAAGKPLVALALGAGTEEKKWPPARLAALAAWIETRLGAALVLIGGPDDFAVGEYVIRQGALQSTANLAGQLPLEVTAAFLRHTELFIGSDSGPLHLASAAGVPCVALFLPEKTRRWTPRVPSLRVVERSILSELPLDAVQQAVLDLKPEWRLRASGTLAPAD